MNNNTLTDEAREKRNAYMREYRKRPGNKERQMEYSRRYWEKQAKQEK